MNFKLLGSVAVATLISLSPAAQAQNGVAAGATNTDDFDARLVSARLVGEFYRETHRPYSRIDVGCVVMNPGLPSLASPAGFVSSRSESV